VCRVVVGGDPDAGTHIRLVRAYGCGDRCIDLLGANRRIRATGEHEGGDEHTGAHRFRVAAGAPSVKQ
jgi:hypothetical protein